MFKHGIICTFAMQMKPPGLYNKLPVNYLLKGKTKFRIWMRRFRGNRRILILDNNEDRLAIMQAALTDEKYRVKVTRDHTEFIMLAATWNPRLLILDLHLREGDGAGVCRVLKASPLTHHIPVILCSAYIVDGTDLSGIEHDAVIRKPFGVAELTGTVGGFF